MPVLRTYPPTSSRVLHPALRHLGSGVHCVTENGCCVCTCATEIRVYARTDASWKKDPRGENPPCLAICSHLYTARVAAVIHTRDAYSECMHNCPSCGVVYLGRLVRRRRRLRGVALGCCVIPVHNVHATSLNLCTRVRVSLALS